MLFSHNNLYQHVNKVLVGVDFLYLQITAFQGQLNEMAMDLYVLCFGVIDCIFCRINYTLIITMHDIFSLSHTKLSKQFLNQIIFFATSDKATYSASVIDKVIMPCKLDIQLTAPSPTVTTYPVVDFRVLSTTCKIYICETNNF